MKNILISFKLFEIIHETEKIEKDPMDYLNKNFEKYSLNEEEIENLRAAINDRARRERERAQMKAVAIKTKAAEEAQKVIMQGKLRSDRIKEYGAKQIEKLKLKNSTK